jgi:putative Mg2+ transporter-C (MgtC) family protein
MISEIDLVWRLALAQALASTIGLERAYPYVDGRGLLRHVLGVCTGRGFSVAGFPVDRSDTQGGLVAVALEIHGRGHDAELAGEIGEIDGVVSVTAGGVNEVFD